MMRKAGNRIWMKISNDAYELPVAVADSADELAMLCGTTANVIYSQMSHYKHGRLRTCPWICVELDAEPA